MCRFFFQLKYTINDNVETKLQLVRSYLYGGLVAEWGRGASRGIIGLLYIILSPVRTPHSRIFLLFMTGIPCLCVVLDPPPPSGTSLPLFPSFLCRCLYLCHKQHACMVFHESCMYFRYPMVCMYTLHWHCQHNCKPSLL